MPQGVLHQRAPDLEDPLLVAEGRDLGVAGELEQVLAAAGDRLELLEQQLGDPAEIYRGALEMHLAGVEPGEVEELLGQLRQALELLSHANEELVSRRLVELLIGEELQMSSQREERRAQLVRGVGDELTAGSLELGETLAHAIERTGQLAELVVGGVDDGFIEAAPRDPVGRLLQSANPARKDMGAAVAHQQGRQQCNRSGSQEAALDESDGLIGIAQRARDKGDVAGSGELGRLGIALSAALDDALLAAEAADRATRDGIVRQILCVIAAARVGERGQRQRRVVDDLEHDCASVRRARHALRQLLREHEPLGSVTQSFDEVAGRPPYLILAGSISSLLERGDDEQVDDRERARDDHEQREAQARADAP